MLRRLASRVGQNVLHMYAAGESAGFIAGVIGAAAWRLLYRLAIGNKTS